MISCCSKGSLILWESCETSGIAPQYEAKFIQTQKAALSLTVCDAVQTSEGVFLIGCLTADSRVLIYKLTTAGFHILIIGALTLVCAPTDTLFGCMSNEYALCISLIL